MNIFIVLYYIVYLLQEISGAYQSTTGSPEPESSAHITNNNLKQLSKTAQIINFVNSVYSDGGKSFSRRAGQNYSPHQGNPVITKISLREAEHFISRMLDLQGNKDQNRDHMRAQENVRYYLIDNPEVLENYRKRRMHKQRRPSRESFVFVNDHGSSSSLEREKNHVVRRYVENLSFDDSDTEMASDYRDKKVNLMTKFVPKAVENRGVNLQPRFPNEDEEILDGNNEGASSKLVKKEGNLIRLDWQKDDHSNFDDKGNKGKDRLNKDIEPSYLKNDDSWSEINDDDNVKMKKSTEETTKDVWIIKDEVKAKTIAKRFKKVLNLKENMDGNESNGRQKDKYNNQDLDKKKESNSDDIANKRDGKMKDETYKQKQSKIKDTGYDWKKDISHEHSNYVDNSKPTTQRENEWDLNDKKLNKNQHPHKISSHDDRDKRREERDDNKTNKWHKSSEEYDKHRPDWDKKIDNHDYDSKNRDTDRNKKSGLENNKDSWKTNNRYKKSNEWNTRDKHRNLDGDWSQRHDKEKIREWDKKEDTKENKRDKNNNWFNRDDRTTKYSDWNEYDKRNKKDNDWKTKDDTNRQEEDDWNKRKDLDKKDIHLDRKNNGWKKNIYDSDSESDKKGDSKDSRNKTSYYSSDIGTDKKYDKFEFGNDKYKKSSTADWNNWDKIDKKSTKDDSYSKKTYNKSEEGFKKKKYDDYNNSFEKKPKKNNEYDDFKPKKNKRDSVEKHFNIRNVPFGRTPIPFVGKKTLYADK